MGRYYNTALGRSGKFGFGCQPSDDPGEFFGMYPISCQYEIYDDESGKGNEKVWRIVDSLYDKAGVPKNERIYSFQEKLDGDSDSEWELFRELYHKYFFRKATEAERKSGKNLFAGETNESPEIEAFKDAYLVQSRLWLGLIILSDIKDEGCCSLDAEM